jgi:hypothetical protein
MRMDLNIAIKNYKIIKQAVLKIDKSLTLIRGQSDNGKTTVFRALKSFIGNDSSIDNITHGQSSFEITINDIVYGRDSQGSFYRIGNNVIRKLSKSPLQDIDDSFPLKLFKIDEDTFFPNLVFQSEIPIFGQLNVYSFFSSLYKSLDIINEKFMVTKKDKADFTVSVNKLTTEVNYIQSEILKDTEGIKAYDPIALKKVIDDYGTYLNLKSNIEKTQQEIKDIQSDLDIYVVYDKYLALNMDYLEKAYLFNSSLINKKNTFTELNNQLSEKSQTRHSLANKIQKAQGLSEISEKIIMKNTFDEYIFSLEKLDNQKIKLNKVSVLAKKANRFKVFTLLSEALSDLTLKSKEIRSQLAGVKKELESFNICPVCNQEIKGELKVDKDLVAKIEGLMGKSADAEKMLKEVDAKISVIKEKLLEFDAEEIRAINEEVLKKEIADIELALEGI